MSTYQYFITGHKGFETLHFHELREILKETDAKISKEYGGVEIHGGLEAAYRICLHSRLSNRVFCELGKFSAANEAQLYSAVYDIDWCEHLTSRHSFSVSATLSRSNIDHSHYASLKVKDAIVDQFRDRVNSRPSIEKQQPNVHIHINIHKNQAQLSLDLSGESLHRRGYRSEHSGAPLKEHLAASMLAQAGWTAEISKTHRLIDPMCGSGTFAIEAATIAANIAPGINRGYFGFTQWLKHDTELWQNCLQEAEAAIDFAVKPLIEACDYDAAAIKISEANASRAGVKELIQFSHQDVADLSLVKDDRSAIIICNPPYGERLQSEQGLANLYGVIGSGLKQFAPAKLYMISANPDLLHRLRFFRNYKKAVRNGPIDCLLAGFDISTPEPQKVEEPASQKVSVTPADLDSMKPLINRLLKNAKHLQRWAKRNNISCYRGYDADLPEYAFALDIYQSDVASDKYWYHLQEYQAPKTINPSVAAERIELARHAVIAAFKVDEDRLFFKTRQRQRGKHQYEKQDHQGELFQVREGNAALLINLSDYLDSGLFLDHRITRQRVSDLSKDQSILNLFSYTGSVGVQAGLAGASKVINVDMSTTYLKWAKENHTINQLVDAERYQFLRADVLALLERPNRYDIDSSFDVIFLDPPSFSNSAKMQKTLDVQRDHELMVQQSMALLNKRGTLFFSTHRQSFKLAENLLTEFDVTDISRETIPEDYKRRPNIHQCWELRHRAFK